MPDNWFETGGDLLVSELENCADKYANGGEGCSIEKTEQNGALFSSSVEDGEAEDSGEDELGLGITGMLTDDLEKREWALHANGNMG